MEIKINSAQEMKDLGRSWSSAMEHGCCYYFEGELGAGKTTLIQGILEGLEIPGPNPSPTFSIMEPYLTKDGQELLHLDLYRIESPEELLYIGIDEFRDSGSTWLIEWPSRGKDIIPEADIQVEIMHAGNARIVSVYSIGQGVPLQ